LVWYGVYKTTSKSLKVLFVALAEKFPEAQEKEILKVIGNLVYYKFINPAVIAPDKYTTY
jgi:hypothetical protein